MPRSPPRPWWGRGAAGRPLPGLVARPQLGRGEGTGRALCPMSPSPPAPAMGCAGVWPMDLGLAMLPSQGRGEMWLGLMWSPAPSSCGRVAATHPASRRAAGPTRDWQGPGLVPCWPCPSRRGSRARPLGSGRGGSCWQRCPPPPSSAEGSAGVGFGCPGPACPQGPASRVADPLWGRAGSLGSASEGFPPSWRRGTCASRATGQPGRRPAGMPCRQLPVCFIVTRRVLGGCRPPSLSLGVTSVHHGVSAPCLAPSWASSCHKSQRIPARDAPVPRPLFPTKKKKNPNHVPHHTHSC